MRRHQISQAFTLIEVLVVVAILALLVAILLPSLQAARNQAKLTMCKANAKQIATGLSVYQAEAQGYVPIMLNWHSGPVYSAPARTVFLSIALRSVEKGLFGLATRVSSTGQLFDPNKPWSAATRDDYEARFLPAHYVCPFERGRLPWDLRQVGSRAPHTLWEWSGVMESYQTWLWEDIVRDEQVYSEPVGWGEPTDGLPQYSVMTWNQVRQTGKPPSDPAIQNQLHRRWADSETRRQKAAGLGGVTVIYCAIGEHMEMGSRRIDLGSHRTARGGGTNAIFGDTHVEWIKGTRIGWP